ncbi:MAG: peptidoglycan-binding protein [Candidatus Omnitrophica bacterium]|nr:peptidoglycan-binding protein [Candidatus Omnitrophota bacterium]
MFKFIVIVFISLLVLSFLNPQTRDYLNEHIQNIFFKEAKQKTKERELIGAVDVYSPRVEEIQTILKNANFYSGRIDGLMGARTRQAIKKFQKEKEITPTGIIDEQTYSLLLKERETQFSLLMQKNKIPDTNLSISIEEPPKIEKSPEEIAKITGPQQEGLTPLEKNKKIQLALKKAGFDVGPIDGKLGPKTLKAIKGFQKKNKLKIDGIVGIKTWEKLKMYLE